MVAGTEGRHPTGNRHDRWAIWLAIGVLFLGQGMDHGSGAEPAKIPIILDTDIGTDIDDAFALALALASPQVEVRGVTTVSADAFTRSLIACRFLDAVGRPMIPVAPGRPPAERPQLTGQYQYGLRAAPKRPVGQSAVEFLYAQLKADPGNLTLVPVGDLTNIAALLTQHPDAKPWIKRIVLMGGAVRKGYSGQSQVSWEWNIHSDVKGAQVVFTSGVPIVMAPLDATIVPLGASLRQKIFSTDTPLCHHLQALYELWGKETPTLFDPVAVTLVFNESFCKLEDLRIEVGDDGVTREVPGKPNARVATSIRLDDFLAWYVDRITRPILNAKDLPTEVAIDVSAQGESRVLGYPLKELRLKQLLAEIAALKSEPQRTVVIRAARTASHAPVLKLLERCQEAGIERVSLAVATESPSNVSQLILRRGMPAQVHVYEDYETEIERRWWLAGIPVKTDVPPGSTRACRAALCRDFDGQFGDRYAIYRAVIFNPVPGPPMGPRTRLSFRYKLRGTDSMRVQIFSLSNGYHRHLTLTGLPQDSWQEGTVDMTQARRPDGSGGPLSKDERIDDIQFYIDPRGDLLIDDVILYDESPAEETQPFPQRVVFTGWFDSGKQGKEWPGQFTIVPYGAERSYNYAQSITSETTGNKPGIVLSMRGARPLVGPATVRFSYRLTGSDSIQLQLVDSTTGLHQDVKIPAFNEGRWSTASESIVVQTRKDGQETAFDQLRFLVDAGAELSIDDVLLYVPGNTKAEGR